MNPRVIDIHGYDKMFDTQKILVENSNISERNKKLIFDFDKQCVLEKLSKPRRCKLMSAITILARDYLKKEFDKAKIDDLKEVVAKINDRSDYSVWTKQSYAVILKKFYSWLTYKENYKDKIRIEGYPKLVSWINTNIKQKDLPRVKASDILTEKEVEFLIAAATEPRDKAFISMLYELGARISEIGNLMKSDISRDKYSYLIDLKGKTGQRSVRIIYSDVYLAQWLNAHPSREHNAPLWVLNDKNNHKKMDYGSLRALILRLKEKSKLKKRIYPHLFRHSRVTHLLLRREINESQAKAYFGWTPSSRELATYSHLLTSDVNDALLEINGIKTTEEQEKTLKSIKCVTCNYNNPSSSLFCGKCAKPLSMKTVTMLEEETKEDSNKLSILLKELEKDAYSRKVMKEIAKKHEWI